jgi:Ca2+-binding EF-hand superfamily protein
MSSTPHGCTNSRHAGRSIRVTTDDTTQAARDTAVAFRIIAGVLMQIAGCVQDEIEEMFARVDKDGDRSISFDEFRAWVSR